MIMREKKQAAARRARRSPESKIIDKAINCSCLSPTQRAALKEDLSKKRN
jgi:hypothetical protein